MVLSVWPWRFVLFSDFKQSVRQWFINSNCTPRDKAFGIAYEPSNPSKLNNRNISPCSEISLTWLYPSLLKRSIAFPSFTAASGLSYFLNNFSYALKPSAMAVRILLASAKLLPSLSHHIILETNPLTTHLRSMLLLFHWRVRFLNCNVCTSDIFLKLPVGFEFRPECHLRKATDENEARSKVSYWSPTFS